MDFHSPRFMHLCQQMFTVDAVESWSLVALVLWHAGHARLLYLLRGAWVLQGNNCLSEFVPVFSTTDTQMHIIHVWGILNTDQSWRTAWHGRLIV